MGETKFTDVVINNSTYTIEYEIKPITHKDASKACGNGVWVYDSERKQAFRRTITNHELPYHYDTKTWNVKGNNHKIVASDKPLCVWWGEGCNKLKFGDLGVALPQIKSEDIKMYIEVRDRFKSSSDYKNKSAYKSI